MYTNLILDIKLKNDLSENIINSLMFLLGETPRFDVSPDQTHPLFNCSRGCFMLIKSSAYKHEEYDYPTTFNIDNKNNWLKISISLKNYDSEIELFLDFIHPFVLSENDVVVGVYKYEEDFRYREIRYNKNEFEIESIIDHNKSVYL